MLKEQEHFTYIFKHTNMSKFGLKKERMAASAGLSHVGFAGEWGDFNTKAGDEVFTPLTPPCLEESSGPVQPLSAATVPNGCLGSIFTETDTFLRHSLQADTTRHEKGLLRKKEWT